MSLFYLKRAASFDEEHRDEWFWGEPAPRERASVLHSKGSGSRSFSAADLFCEPLSVGARPRQLRGPREDDSPERPAAGRRLVADDGEDGGQHAKEEHKQQRRQVKVVGPAGQPSATCGRHSTAHRW